MAKTRAREEKPGKGMIPRLGSKGGGCQDVRMFLVEESY